MTPIEGERFTAFLTETFGDHLRSVIHYTHDGHEFLFFREDVREQYSEAQIERIVQDHEMESMGKFVEETRFAHGDLRCRIHVFDDGVEMNFMIGDGEGIAVGLETGAFVTHETFVGRCLEIAGLE